MARLKNLHLLTAIVQPDDIKLIEEAELQHKRYSNITFKVVELTDKKIVFKVEQGKNAARVYHPAKRLIEIVTETFGRFVPGRKIIAGPVPYKEPAPNQVTSEWVVKQMKEKKIRLKQIADETGIDYSSLSAVTTGTKDLSQMMKALLWYYFLSMGNRAD